MQELSNSTLRAPRSHWPVTALSLISAAINIAIPIALVRILPLEEVGRYKIFFLYLTLPPAVFLSTGIVNGLAMWAGHGEEGVRRIQLSSILLLLIGALAGISAFMSRGMLEHFIGFTADESLYFSLAVFGAITSSYFEEAIIFSGRVWLGGGFQALSEALRAIGILVVALFTRDLGSILISHTIFSLIKTVSGYALGIKFKVVGIGFSRKDIAPLLRYAIPVSAAALFGLALVAGDQFLLTSKLSTSEFALYAIGCLSLPPLLILEYSVARTLIPRLSAAFVAGKSEEAMKLYRDAVSQLAVLVVPSVVGLVLLCEPLIITLFTEKFVGASSYLALFALSYLTLIVPPDATARARGESKWIFYQSMFFGVLALTFVFFGIHFGGALGALIASLLVKTAQRIYALHYAARSCGWDLRRVVPTGLVLASLVASLLAASIAQGVLEFVELPTLKLFIGGSIYLIAYGLSFYFCNRYIADTLPRSARVLMITQYLGVGGLERTVLSLSRALSSGKLAEVSVFAFDQHSKVSYQNLVSDFKASQIPVYTFEKGPGFSPGVVRYLYALIHEKNIGILHTHDLGGLIYGTIAKILTMGRVRIIHTQHSFVHLRKARRYKVYEKLFTLFTDSLTVVSEGTKSVYRELGLSESRITVVPNGIEFSSRMKVSGRTREEKRAELLKAAGIRTSTSAFRDLWLIYMARFHPVKGQDHALALWNELPNQIREQSYLFLIGPEAESGEYARIDRIIADSKNQERIIRPGGTSDPQAWIDLADCYLSCSEFEGLPLAPIEAIGRGIPALLSAIEGHSFLADVSEQYPLDKPHNGAEKLSRIAEQILKKAPDTQYRIAAQQLQKRFAVSQMAGRYAELYKGV